MAKQKKQAKTIWDNLFGAGKGKGRKKSAKSASHRRKHRKSSRSR